MPDPRTSKEIDKIVKRILKEAGLTEPPVRVEDLLAHLDLDRGFYSLEDPTLLRVFWHKVKVGGHKLKGIANKIKLAAVWLPDEERILVDKDLPAPKQEWASFHDATHTVLPWHQRFFLGDTAQTLHPDFQEMLENEANYGASGFMFCGELFTKEALQTPVEWSSVEILKKRYKKSWVTTVRRYVEFGPDKAMAVLISTPSWLEKPEDQPERWRHFVVSNAFRRQFTTVSPADVLKAVDANVWETRGGPAGNFSVVLKDINDDVHEFSCEAFFNQHDLITLIVHQQPLGKNIVIFPKRFEA